MYLSYIEKRHKLLPPPEDTTYNLQFHCSSRAIYTGTTAACVEDECDEVLRVSLR
jgi:hypothetical protein